MFLNQMGNFFLKLQSFHQSFQEKEEEEGEEEEVIPKSMEAWMKNNIGVFFLNKKRGFFSSIFVGTKHSKIGT